MCSQSLDTSLSRLDRQVSPVRYLQSEVWLAKRQGRGRQLAEVAEVAEVAGSKVHPIWVGDGGWVKT